MFSWLRPRLTYANVAATLALIIALAAGGPALAEPVANTAASVTSKIKNALRIAKRADRRSKRAESLSKQALATPGPKGEKGDPGPATGPAGGALTGNYPDPLLAAGSVGPSQLATKAVTGDRVANNTLGGDQILESSLVGFDTSTVGPGGGGPPGAGLGTGLANGLFLWFKCTGAAGNIGFKLEIDSAAAQSRFLYTNVITDGQPPELGRSTILPEQQGVTIVDVPASSTSDLLHWVTVLIPAPTYETRAISVRTKVSGQNSCDSSSFRTVASG